MFPITDIVQGLSPVAMVAVETESGLPGCEISKICKTPGLAPVLHSATYKYLPLIDIPERCVALHKPPTCNIDVVATRAGFMLESAMFAMLPITCNACVGVDVPIPTVPEAVTVKNAVPEVLEVMFSKLPVCPASPWIRTVVLATLVSWNI